MAEKITDQMTRPGPHPAAGTRRYAQKSVDERRAERRARILAAGLEAFGDRGYRATTITALCAAANVSTRTFYEEMGSLEALLIALHDDLNARALAAVVAAMSDVDLRDLPARAAAGTLAYFREMTRDRRWARLALIESVGVSAQAEAHRRAAVDGFVALLGAEAGRLAAEGRIPERDHHLTAVALAGAVNGLIGTWTGEAGWDERQVERLSCEAARLIVLGLMG